jgi:hypothetical protein
MAEAKTKATKLSVAAYFDAIEDDVRRKDCKALSAIMRRATGCAPVMWGTGIVGFDSYHYKYASGHEGDMCLVGFAARKGDISVYMPSGYEGASALLASLGKHKFGKSCMYIRRLADVDVAVLEQLVVGAVAEMRRRYPAAKA